MNKIVVTQPVHPEVQALLRQAGDVVMNPGPEPWTSAELAHHLSDADAMMAFMTDRVDAAVLAGAPRLRTIACALKGYDNFDLVACRDAGVKVSFVPDLLTEPTAELAVGLAIAAGRNVLPGDAAVRKGYAGWRPTLYGKGLHGSVAAVIGLGAVGRAIVDRLSGFGCARILGVDPRRGDGRAAMDTTGAVEMVSLEQAIARADYVLLAVPLVPGSVHLIDAAMLARARPGMVLVNIGRGSVVDEAAVAAALQAGTLGAYAADVYEMEDWLLEDRPRSIHPGLLAHPATVLTPHIGSAVQRVRLAIEMRAAGNLVQALRGEELADLVA